MTKRMRFFYNGAVMTAVGLAMRGIQLLFGAYIARAVGAEAVGLNSLIMTVYSFGLTLAGSGISLTVTRLVAEAVGCGREEEIGRILRGAIIYALIFGGVATVGLFTLSGVLGVRFISDIRAISALRILSLSLLPVALSAVFSGYFIASRRVTLNAATQSLCQLVRIGVTVLAVSRASGSEGALTALAVGVTLSEVLSALFSGVIYILCRVRSRSGRGADFRGVLGMALPLALSNYIRSALLSLEHNLIPKRLRKRGESNEAALSSYGYLNGMALPMILYPLTPLTAFSGLLVPEFAEAHGAGNERAKRRIATLAINNTLAYATSVGVLIYFFAEELGYVVYSSYDAGRYIAMLSFVVPIMYLDHVTDAMLKGIGEHIYSMWVNILDAVLSVALVYILIPIMGIGGYAVVIIVMEGVNFLLSFLRLRKRIRFEIKPLGAVIAPLVSGVLAVAISDRAFFHSGSATTPLLLVMKLVFATSALVAIYICLTGGGKCRIKNAECRIKKSEREMQSQE